MGCPGSQAKATGQLPIVNSTVRMASRGKVARDTSRAAAKPLRPIRDFHCPDCGLTKPNYPNYFHRCPGIDANGPIDYQAYRESICGECKHTRKNESGKVICLPLKTKHPDYPCVVSIGIRMPTSECPLKRWRRVVFVCDRCGSARFNAEGLTRCPVCSA